MNAPMNLLPIMAPRIAKPVSSPDAASLRMTEASSDTAAVCFALLGQVTAITTSKVATAKKETIPMVFLFAFFFSITSRASSTT